MPRSQTGRAPISASACAMSSPPVRMFEVPQARERERARPVAMRPGDSARPAASADFQPSCPGRRRRHRAGIDRIEVAPGRQHVGPPARRRAGRARAPRTGRRGRRSSAGDLGRAGAVERRARARCAIQSRTARVRAASPARGSRALAGDQPPRQQLEPLDRVAGACATASARDLAAGMRRAGRGPRPGSPPGRSRAGRSRARDRRRARAMQRGVAGLARRRAARARARPACRSAARPPGDAPRTCSPSRICSSFSSQRWASSCRARRRRRRRAAMPRSRSRPMRARELEDLRRAAACSAARVDAGRDVIFVDQRLELGAAGRSSRRASSAASGDRR